MDIVSEINKGNPICFSKLNRDEFFYWDTDHKRIRLCLRTGPKSFYDLTEHCHYSVRVGGSVGTKYKDGEPIEYSLHYSIVDDVVPVYVELKVKCFK